MGKQSRSGNWSDSCGGGEGEGGRKEAAGEEKEGEGEKGKGCNLEELGVLGNVNGGGKQICHVAGGEFGGDRE